VRTPQHLHDGERGALFGSQAALYSLQGAELGAVSVI
jgi:hypothetical protein